MIKSILTVTLALVTANANAGQDGSVTEAAADKRPNILLIVADDLGYSDLGTYGGEIDTPNLDALAQSGVQLTNFHTAPSCSPTRAQLMTGIDNHLVGLGVMAEYRNAPTLGKPGYEGYLNFQAATLPELLADAGYHTFMAGKWHLGRAPEQQPSARGFERSFALLGGGAAHLDDMSVYGPDGGESEKAEYRENGEVSTLPKDFYSTRFYTDKLIEYIDAEKESGKPFFGYLAYTAPHWPLQAPKASIDKYKGRYDAGYDVLKKERIARMKELGLIPQDVEYDEAPSTIAAWNTLDEQQKRVESRAMEVYAAMVDDVDKNVGRLFEYLKSIDQYDNTLVVFISDNGPAPSTADHMPKILEAWHRQCCDLSYENMGNARSWVLYGIQWAIPGAGHLRGVKGEITEGGTRVPAMLGYPGLKKAGERLDGFSTAKDLLPTFLDIAGTSHPGTSYKGRDVLPVQGESLWPVLNGDAEEFHSDDYVAGWEMLGTAAVTQGDWKLLKAKPPFGEMQFQLYNLADDPGEVNDLSQTHPDKFKQMMSVWDRYVEENGVIKIESN